MESAQPSKSTTSFYRYIHFPESKASSLDSSSKSNMPAFKNIAVVGVSDPPQRHSLQRAKTDNFVLQASGDIGKIILKSLIDSSEFNLTVISRKDSNAVFPNGVAVRKVDFSVEALAEAFAGHEAVISVLGAAAFDQQKKLVNAALRAGVQRFFPSEYSASSQDKAVQELLPLFGLKSELIEYLKSKEAEGLSWTGIAPSGLFDWVSHSNLIYLFKGV